MTDRSAQQTPHIPESGQHRANRHVLTSIFARPPPIPFSFYIVLEKFDLVHCYFNNAANSAVLLNNPIEELIEPECWILGFRFRELRYDVIRFRCFPRFYSFDFFLDFRGADGWNCSKCQQCLWKWKINDFFR